jgi:hypothetical protein
MSMVHPAFHLNVIMMSPALKHGTHTIPWTRVSSDFLCIFIVHARFFETSANTGENVQPAFHALFSTVVRGLPQR